MTIPTSEQPTFEQEYLDSLSSKQVESVSFVLPEGQPWTVATLARIRTLDGWAREQGKTTTIDGLPPQAMRVLALARQPLNSSAETAAAAPPDFLTRLGENALSTARAAQKTGEFLGEIGRSLGRFLTGRAQYQTSDLIAFIRDTGPQAIPLVGLVNLLLGVILAFMGAIQLQQFGAQIFVADLVAIGLTREIAPMMTAIILAGRTGAAYAAQLGTMQVNEEIDAFKTFGFSPVDFLVLPRMLALAIMTPLLVLYADAIGMIGGFVVGVLLLDIGGAEYLAETRNAVGLGDIFVGVFKGSIFGILVAIAGCLKGMQSGRNASAVGQAATGAVVSGIVAIIIATAFFAVITNVLGI